MSRYRIVARKRKQAFKLVRPSAYPGGIIPSYEIANKIAANLREQGYETRLHKLEEPIEIIGRGTWGARAPLSVTRDYWTDGVDIIVHHTAGAVPLFNTRILEFRIARQIQLQHMAKGWSDIGYNYLIMPSGRILTGRGFGVRGAHVENHNTDTCGISFVGDYSKKRPTPEAIDAYRKLRRELERNGAKIRRTRRHSDLNPTACPAMAGDAVGLPR